MKSVLISIQPKYCELIANGKKTVEVRKTKPKIDVPFKCYIYCTKDKKNTFFTKQVFDGEKGKWAIPYVGNGNVIGEFVCDRIDEYLLKEFEWESGDISPEYHIPTVEGEKTCLEYDELKEYGNNKTLYFWHITDLVIYDKLKELGEFYQTGINEQNHCYFDYCAGCIYHETPVCEHPCNECDGNRKYFYRPPQSWAYCELEG